MPGPFSADDHVIPDISKIRGDAVAIKATLQDARNKIAAKRHQGAVEGPVEPKPGSGFSRAQGLWPFLLIRSFPGDFGARPTQVPDMNHSPDIILIHPNSEYAPTVITREGMPELQRRKTIIVWQGWKFDVLVHVWNLGRTAANGVRIRVWAKDPAGGIEFIGGRQLDLGDRTSANSHLAVKVGSWKAKSITDIGHQYEIIATAECIVDVATGATQDRHTAVRKIAVQHLGV